MILLENTEVVGFEPAIRGMRNPMNSWDRSDSLFEETREFDPDDYPYRVKFGPNDLDLMRKLARSGPVHAKYRRMISVYVDITAPLYWWKEFDTYKVGTVANSCSTMHKIHDKEFTLGDFSCEHLLQGSATAIELYSASHCSPVCDGKIQWTPMMSFLSTVCMLNDNREKYLETKDKVYWWQMIQLLPSSYNQKRTILMNYEVLSNIMESRQNHKLDEWRILCDWIKGLPVSELIFEEEK